MKGRKDSIEILFYELKPLSDGIFPGGLDFSLKILLNQPLKLLLILILLLQLKNILPHNPARTFLKRVTIITQHSNIQILIIKLNETGLSLSLFYVLYRIREGVLA